MRGVADEESRPQFRVPQRIGRLCVTTCYALVKRCDSSPVADCFSERRVESVGPE